MISRFRRKPPKRAVLFVGGPYDSYSYETRESYLPRFVYLRDGERAAVYRIHKRDDEQKYVFLGMMLPDGAPIG